MIRGIAILKGKTVPLLLTLIIFAVFQTFQVFNTVSAETAYFSGNASPVYEGGKQTGILIDGNAQMNRDVGLNGFSANFVLPIPAQTTVRATLSNLNSPEEEYLSFTFVCGEKLGGAINVGGQPAADFNNIAYLGEAEVQFSIALEKQVNTETGADYYTWVVRVNSFSRSFTDGSPQAVSLSSNVENRFLYGIGIDGGNITVHAAGGNYFYDYDIIGSENVYLQDNSLRYASLVLMWDIPEGYSQRGYIISRYAGGVFDKEIRIGSGVISTLADKNLEHGTDYSYVIIAYDSLNPRIAPCPKILFKYENFSAKTLKGNFLRSLIILIIIITAIIALIVVYTFYYRIKGRNRRRQQNGK